MSADSAKTRREWRTGDTTHTSDSATNCNTMGFVLGFGMDGRGKHLDCAERAVVISEVLPGSSQGQIARLLGRAPRTIWRELARACPPEGTAQPYCPQRDQRVYDKRRATCRPKRKLVRGGETYLFVRRHLLELRWCPEQIATPLRAMHQGDPSALREA